MSLGSGYTTLRTLGSGAFATVFLVRRKSDSRLFAAKSILISSSSSSAQNNTTTQEDQDGVHRTVSFAIKKAEAERHAARERILKEVRVMQSLPPSPCIVQLEEVIESRDAITLILEYVPGGTLADKIYGAGKDFDPATMPRDDHDEHHDEFDDDGFGCGDGDGGGENSNGSEWNSDSDFRKQVKKVAASDAAGGAVVEEAVDEDDDEGAGNTKLHQGGEKEEEEDINAVLEAQLAAMQRDDSALDLFHSKDRNAFRAMFDQSNANSVAALGGASPQSVASSSSPQQPPWNIHEAEVHGASGSGSGSNVLQESGSVVTLDTSGELITNSDGQFSPAEAVPAPAPAAVVVCRPAPLPESQIRQILTQLANAFALMHANGVTHRDCKVHNIFLAANGVVKVGDFGIAALRNEYVHSLASTGASDDQLGGDADELAASSSAAFGSMIASTAAAAAGAGAAGAATEHNKKRKNKNNTANINNESVLGTPYALSPELLAGTWFDQRVDVWALGVLAFELVCRRPPFYASNLLALTFRVLNDEVPPLPTAALVGNSACQQEGVTVISEDLALVIRWMLTKEAPLRPTMADVVQGMRLVNNGRDVEEFIDARKLALRAAAGGRAEDDEESEAVEEMVAAVMSSAAASAVSNDLDHQHQHHQLSGVGGGGNKKKNTNMNAEQERQAAYEESRRQAAANKQRWKNMENEDHWQSMTPTEKKNTDNEDAATDPFTRTPPSTQPRRRDNSPQTEEDEKKTQQQQQQRNEAFWETRRAAEENRRRAREATEGRKSPEQKQKQGLVVAPMEVQQLAQEAAVGSGTTGSVGAFMPGVISSPSPFGHHQPPHQHQQQHEGGETTNRSPSSSPSAVGVVTPPPLQQITSVGLSPPKSGGGGSGGCEAENESFLTHFEATQRRNEERMKAFFNGSGNAGSVPSPTDGAQRKLLGSAESTASQQQRPVVDDDEFLNASLNDEGQMPRPPPPAAAPQVIAVGVRVGAHSSDADEAEGEEDAAVAKHQQQQQEFSDDDDEFVLEDEDEEPEAAAMRNNVVVTGNTPTPTAPEHHAARGSSSSHRREEEEEEEAESSSFSTSATSWPAASSSSASSRRPVLPPPPQQQQHEYYQSKHNRNSSFDAPFAVNFCANCLPAGKETPSSFFCQDCGSFLCELCSREVHSIALFSAHHVVEISPEQENNPKFDHHHLQQQQRRNIGSPPNTAPASANPHGGGSSVSAAAVRATSPSSSSPSSSTAPSPNKYASPSTAPTISTVPSAPFEGLGLSASPGGVAFEIGAFSTPSGRGHSEPTPNEEEEGGGGSAVVSTAGGAGSRESSRAHSLTPPQSAPGSGAVVGVDNVFPATATTTPPGGDAGGHDDVHHGMNQTIFTPMRVERVEPADTDGKKKKVVGNEGCCSCVLQ